MVIPAQLKGALLTLAPLQTSLKCYRLTWHPSHPRENHNAQNPADKRSMCTARYAFLCGQASAAILSVEQPHIISAELWYVGVDYV